MQGQSQNMKTSSTKRKLLGVLSYRLAHKVPVLLVALVIAFTGTTVGVVRADTISDQINQLRQENAANRNTVAQLQDQAVSYQDAINKLQAAINTLQAQINANTAEQARLQAEMTKAEEELAKQKTILGENIKQMYLEGEISTLEMLASSKDLGEFVDKEQYRNSVQGKIKDTMDKITELRRQLRDQKDQVEKLLEEQKVQQAAQEEGRRQQAELLAYNQGQQTAYNQKTKDNQKKIDDLVASQRKANFNPDGGYYFLRFPGNPRGFSPDSYPYRNAGFGMSPGPGCVDNDGPDAWGYCTRQCVSYAAWAVVASGRSAPMYYGNARDWVAAAYARGIPVYRNPEPGDIAISTAGYWGHAMYVESVSGNTFRTSEYNTYLTGQLSYQTRNY